MHIVWRFLPTFLYRLGPDSLPIRIRPNDADSNRQHWSNGACPYLTMIVIVMASLHERKTPVRLRLSMIQVMQCCISVFFQAYLHNIPTIYVVGCTKSLLRTSIVDCGPSPNSDPLFC
jgi:hypothetical protein